MGRGRLEQRLLVQFLKLKFIAFGIESADGPSNLVTGKFRPPIRMIHREFARPAQNLMIHGKRCAHGKPRIARGGLHINTLERCAIEYFSVRYAIKSNSARKA